MTLHTDTSDRSVAVQAVTDKCIRIRLIVPGNLLDKMNAACEHLRIGADHIDKACAILAEMKDAETATSATVEAEALS